MTGALLTAVGATLLVGALGVVISVALSVRSLRGAVLAAPLVAVAAMGAGVLVGTHMMLLTTEGSGQLTLIVLAPLAVSLAVGIALAWRVAAIDRAREAERSRRELISHLSHDLRTPLAGIRAMSEALADGVGTEREQYPGRMLEQIDRAIGMSDDLLSLATLDGSTTGNDRTAWDLGDLLSDAVAGHRVEAERRGITLAGDSPGPLPVRGSAREVDRAIANVLGNAVRHTPDGGTVTIGATPESGGRRLRVTVRDQCGGISAETAEHMFEAFWREDAARSPGAPGAGLGLTIVQAVARAHGGDAGVTPARGCCEVWFSLAR